MKETRDEYYRTFKESDKYNVEVEGLFDKEGNDLKGEVKVRTSKKKRNPFLKRIKVYNPENLEVRTVQDNKLIQKHSNIDDYTFLIHPTEKESIPLISYPTTSLNCLIYGTKLFQSILMALSGLKAG